MENLVQYKEAPKSLVKTIEQSPQWDNYQIYNKNCVFKVESYGLLKMLFLKFTITPNTDSTYAIPTSPHIIENASLLSNGIAVASVNTAYTLARIDRLVNSSLYSQMIAASTVTGTGDPLVFTGTQTISLPLFFFAIDGQMINPNDYQNLTVSVRTKSSRGAMGFDEDIASLSVKLFAIYEQMEVYPEKRVLQNPYNVAQDVTLVASGVSKTIVKLNNPSEILYLIFMLRTVSDSAVAVTITNVVVDCPTGNVGTFDKLTNFTLNNSNAVSNAQTFQIDFSDYIKANKNMFPLICTVNHATTTEACSLFVNYEYRSDIIDNNGFLFETFEEKF